MEALKNKVFKKCQGIFPAWRDVSIDRFEFDPPKGFSTFTMGVRALDPIEPPAVLYRHLEGKENAILDYGTEKSLFLKLGEESIAAHCHHYDDTCRIESFYPGRTLAAEDVYDHATLRKIGEQLHRFHQLKPENLPSETFFELLHRKWGEQAKEIVVNKRHVFPDNEAQMCEKLEELFSEETIAKVRRCLPDEEPVFCHNDTYHGNIMKLNDGGAIKLLDFEFSCLNYRAFDFSNLFAETVMKHGQDDYPYFHIGEPEYTILELEVLINAYLDHSEFGDAAQREREFTSLFKSTQSLIMLSDYMYSMAALPLALEPIQKIRFIPYAFQRFSKFLLSFDERFPAG